MKLDALEVKAFRGIVSAKISFEAGLNLLVGPNEAGKSTLAEALRSVLLRRAGSTLTTDLQPKRGGGTPEVELTYTLADGHIYRIHKRFGSKIEANLDWSKDGVHFSTVERGAGADTKLREQLSWGLADIGGRGGPRSLESTFLTRTLLAGQSEVESILEQGLESEGSSQTALLQRALAVASEDPRFKRALALATRAEEQFWSKSRRKTTRAASPWKRATSALTKAEADLGRLESNLAEVEGLERELGVRIEAQSEARDAQAKAWDRVRELEGLEEAARRRFALVKAKEGAEAEVGRVRELEGRTRELEAERAEGHAQLSTLTAQLEAAFERVASTEAEVRAKEASVREVEQSGEGSQLRLQEADIDTRLAHASAERLELEGLRERAQASVDRIAALERAREGREAQLEKHGAATSDYEAALAELEGLELELGAARAAEARARCAEAEARLTRASEGAKRARAAVERRDALGAEEGPLLRRVAAFEGLTQTLVDDLTQRWNELERRRSAASAGLSVSVERLSPVALQVGADGAYPHGITATTEPLKLEAQRALFLEVGQLARLAIVAGSTEVREALAAAEASWKDAGAPVLERFGLTSVAELAERLRAVEVDRRRIEAIGKEISELVATGVGLDAALEEETAARAALERANAQRAQGPETPEHASTRSVDDLEEAIRQARAKKEEAGLSRAGAEQALEAAKRRLEEAERTLHSARAQIEGEPSEALEAAERGLVELEAARVEMVAEREGLAEALAERLAAAKAALERAVAAHEKAKAERAGLSEQRAAARTRIGELDGALRQLSEQLASENLPAKLEALAVAEARLAEVAPVEFTTEALEQAQAALAQSDARVREAESEVSRVQGALERTDGDVAKSRAEEARQKVADEEAGLRKVEVQAEASKLLVDVLREAEQSVSKHLGVGVSQLVSERFSALTDARYEQVRVDETLVAGKVSWSGGTELSPGELSVGTRHQLATLLRVILAEQIGHPVLLDDQLVQSDAGRMRWLTDRLLESANATQIIVLSCRGDEYRSPDSGDQGIHLIDVPSVVRRLEPA